MAVGYALAPGRRRLFGPRAVLTGGVWLLQFAVLTAFSFVGRYPHALDATLRRVVMTLAGVALCLAIGRILDRTPLRPASRRWRLALVLALAASVAWALLAYAVIHFHPADHAVRAHGIGVLREVSLNAAALACVFSAWACGWLAIGYSDTLAHRERALADAETAAEEARGGLRELELRLMAPPDRTVWNGNARNGRADIWVQTRRGAARLRLETVELFEAEHDYVRVHAPSGEHLVHGGLQALYDELEPDLFLRVHRSFVVNLSAVAQVERRQRGLIELILASGARVPVGRTYSKTVRTRLQATGLRR